MLTYALIKVFWFYIALTCQNHERLVKTMNDMLITLSINGYDKTDAYAIIQVFN